MSNKDHNNKTSYSTFSSSLLNQIYLSLDRETAAGDRKISTSTLRRPHLVDNWMDKPTGEKPPYPAPLPRQRRSPPPVAPTTDDDPDSFFSTTSVSSSDSSSGGFSETETPSSFNGSSKPRSSCFGPLRAPKPVKTRIKGEDDIIEEDVDGSKSSSSTSRALKIYSQLKNLKQPISPGLKLAKYINSLFVKESKKKHNNRTVESTRAPKVPCKRNVKFNLDDGLQMGREGLTKRYAELRRINRDGNENEARFEANAIDLFKRYCSSSPRKDDTIVDLNVDDSTCSSSDLFELDRLSIIGNDELPVYETTNLP